MLFCRQAVCREIEGLGCLGMPDPPSGEVPLGMSSGEAPPDLRGTPTEEKPAGRSDEFFSGGQDGNSDGQVSEEEFSRHQGDGTNGTRPEAAVKAAFACLDPDGSGHITRQEVFQLQTRLRAPTAHCHPGPRSASLGLADACRVHMRGLRYNSVNFGAEESSGLPNW